MKLYYLPGACSLSPHIVACEAGLPVELSKVTFSGAARTTEEGEDFFAVNPRGGYVPALRLDSGYVLTEGPAIVQYLSDQAPAAHLMPDRESENYYRVLSWLTFISSELHKGFSPLYRSDLPESERAVVVGRLEKRYAYLDEALAGKDYLLGTDFSVADAYCYTILRWSERAGIEVSTYPHLAAYLARVEKRSGVQKALKEEGLEPIVRA